MVYKGKEQTEAVISFNQETGSLLGSLTDTGGRSFTIARCEGGHVIKQYDDTSQRNSSALELDELDTSEDDDDDDDDVLADVWRSKARPRPNKIERVSIMFYYTADLLRKTPDMEGFLDHLIAQQNQAFVNSKVPVRVFKFCSRKETVPALTS